MIKRTIYIGNPAYLSLEHKQLKVTKGEELLGTVPIEDIGYILLDNPQITITHNLIRALQSNNVALISCDEKHMPKSLMLPLEGHSEQMAAQRTQLNSSLPLKNNLWKQTIIAKILNQSVVLNKLGFVKESRHLFQLTEKVKSADRTAVEGYAAKVYWDILLEGKGRGRFGASPNHLLNYGYAILRSMVARAIVGAGLLPTIGIHHKNKFNAFCLSDDIMEPFRPFMDLLVLERLNNEAYIENNNINKEDREFLLSIMTVDAQFNKKRRPLMVGAEETMASLRKCFEGKRKNIIFPKLV